MDLFDKIHEYTDAREAMEAGLYPYFPVVDRQDGTEARISDRDVIMCGSNNYPGLSNHRRVVEASAAALHRYGTSCTGSRFLNGNLRLHEELEAELARFYGREDALVFSTGFQANLGTISAVAGRGDVVLLDREAHASAIDAARLSGARVRFFRHNDVESLERKLAGCARDAGVLVVVEGVYSMAGDICPLPEVIDVARRHGARVLLDDAHGLGVLAGGRGTEAHFGGGARSDLVTVTFSKALASVGGAVVGSRAAVDYLRHHARSLIFSAAMTPAGTAAALAALRVLAEEPWRAERAMSNAAYVRRALTARGVSVGASVTPIVPVPLEDVTRTFTVWRNLLDRGVYVNAVIPPAASCRLRMSFLATHTVDQLDRVVSAVASEVAEPAVLNA